MNALTYEFLSRWQHDLHIMSKTAPDSTPHVWLNPIDRWREPWPSIVNAANIMERIGRDSPGQDSPPLFFARHRLAWLNLLRAAAGAAGHGDYDAPRWHKMTAAAIAEELAGLISEHTPPATT